MFAKSYSERVRSPFGRTGKHKALGIPALGATAVNIEIGLIYTEDYNFKLQTSDLAFDELAFGEADEVGFGEDVGAGFGEDFLGVGGDGDL